MSHGDSGHDWSHIERVRNLALNIANEEKNKGREVDLTVVEFGALMHDIADYKFHNGDEELGPRLAEDIMTELNYPKDTINSVIYIIRNISFKGAKVENKMKSLEGLIVQDADRIDALGAIGIARCFSYGGFKQRVMYDPTISPVLHSTPEEYKSKQSTTINHFYEKLFLLKDMMNTESGRKIAQDRHNFMVQFIDQFMGEWKGEK